MVAFHVGIWYMGFWHAVGVPRLALGNVGGQGLFLMELAAIVRCVIIDWPDFRRICTFVVAGRCEYAWMERDFANDLSAY